MPACPNCGNTRNPANVSQCQVCGVALAGGTSTPLAAASSGGPKSPALIDSHGKCYRISITGETHIGSRGCAISLPDPKIAPRHARIFSTRGQFHLEDLAGGITLNGRPVNGPVQLNTNDVLVIGNSQFRVDLPGGNMHAIVPTGPAKPVTGQKTTIPMVSSATPAPNASFTGKNGQPPLLEGTILHIDGPHLEEPEFGFWGAIVRSVLFPLVLWKPNYSPLVYGTGQPRQVPARYLRIKDNNGQVFVVKMKGEIHRGMVSLGDQVAVWGKWDGGTLVMDYAYNLTVNSVVSLIKVL